MITRRKFINIILGGGLIGWVISALYPVIKFLIPPEELEAQPNVLKVIAKKDFPPGASKIVKFGKQPVILVHSKDGELIALSAKCTHLDCIVQYRQDSDIIWCACHNGKYDLNGKNISGPPPKPLEKFVVKVIDDEVFVAKA